MIHLYNNYILRDRHTTCRLVDTNNTPHLDYRVGRVDYGANILIAMKEYIMMKPRLYDMEFIV